MSSHEDIITTTKKKNYNFIVNWKFYEIPHTYWMFHDNFFVNTITIKMFFNKYYFKCSTSTTPFIWLDWKTHFLGKTTYNTKSLVCQI